MDNKNDKEFISEDIDRIIIEKNIHKIKIVLNNGERILVDYNNIEYVK